MTMLPVQCCLAPGGAEPANPRCGEGGHEGFWGFSLTAETNPEVTVSGNSLFQQGTTESMGYVSFLRSHFQISVKTIRAHLGFIPTHN